MYKKKKFNRIPEKRREQIVLFCEDLGLVPRNLVTPKVIEMIYNEWRESHMTHVISEEQMELTREYFDGLLRKYAERRSCVRFGEDLFSRPLYLNFDNPSENLEKFK